MVVLVLAFCWLGKWQWATAHNNATRKVLDTSNAQKRVPIDQVLRPGAEFQNSTSLRPVSAEGRFDAAHTLLVAGRVLHGKNGWWVMTPVIVDGSGARLPVVRGFVTKTTGIPAPPTGRVHVEGALAPGESQATGSNYPAGQIGTIDMGLLLNSWGGTVYNAFIFETGQKPAGATGSTQVTLVPPPIPTKTSINLRNAAYAIQWWVFAMFAVFMWFKMVRDDALLESAHDEEKATGDSGPGDADNNDEPDNNDPDVASAHEERPTGHPRDEVVTDHMVSEDLNDDDER